MYTEEFFVVVVFVLLRKEARSPKKLEQEKWKFQKSWKQLIMILVLYWPFSRHILTNSFRETLGSRNPFVSVTLLSYNGD